MLKRVAIVMGRGVEGCGVTKYCVELCNYLETIGCEYVVVAVGDKRWTRHKAHEIKNLRLLKFIKEDSVREMTEACDWADVVLLNSLPNKGHGTTVAVDDVVVNNFIKSLKAISKPIVFIQHDHNKLSIMRNSGIAESVRLSKVLFSHAPDNDFSRLVNNEYRPKTLDDFLSESSNDFEICNFQPGMNFDAVRAAYWSRVEDVDLKLHRWVGRTATWKGYRLMYNFHEKHLRKMKHATIMEGIEKSPAYIVFKEDVQDFAYRIPKNPDDYDAVKDRGKPISVYSHFKNHDLLRRMSKTGFGYQLTNLDPRYIKHSIEYTHCEVVATGTVPVFRKEYGDACIHRKTGDSLTAVDSGTLWLTDENMKEVASKISSLSKDAAAWNDARECAYEYYKSHQDSSFVMRELMLKIENTI